VLIWHQLNQAWGGRAIHVHTCQMSGSHRPFTPAIMSPVSVPSTLPFSRTMNCLRHPGAPLDDTAAASWGVFWTICKGKGNVGDEWLLKCEVRMHVGAWARHGLLPAEEALRHSSGWPGSSCLSWLAPSIVLRQCWRPGFEGSCGHKEHIGKTCDPFKPR
jgi:hypothetical protein